MLILLVCTGGQQMEEYDDTACVYTRNLCSFAHCVDRDDKNGIGVLMKCIY